MSKRRSVVTFALLLSISTLSLGVILTHHFGRIEHNVALRMSTTCVYSQCWELQPRPISNCLMQHPNNGPKYLHCSNRPLPVHVKLYSRRSGDFFVRAYFLQKIKNLIISTQLPYNRCSSKTVIDHMGPCILHVRIYYLFFLSTQLWKNIFP